MTTTQTLPTVTDPNPVPRAAGRPVRPLALRLALTRRAVLVALTALFGTALFPLWLTLVALSPLTLVAPLVLPATWLVRRFADVHRTTGALDRPIASPYRTSDAGVLRQVVTIVRDPASWRDAAWLVVHSVVGFVTALLTVTLALAGVFYLIFPFLWSVTPRAAFGHQFGFVEIDTLARAFACVPLALVAFGLWWGLSVPLARLDAYVNRSLLGPVADRPAA